MLPSAFVVLPQLPRTSNGKIDAAALPAPEINVRQREYIPPRNLQEEIVCDIWREMLDHAPVGVEDNFFEIGGHSLVATRVMSRINRAFKVEIPLRLFFEESTVSGLVKRVQQAQGKRNNLENLMNLLEYKLQRQKTRA